MTTDRWTACGVVSAVVLPVVVAMVVMYSDVQSLKVSKADIHEVTEIRLEYTNQMTRNTIAIENLVVVTKDMQDFLKGMRTPVN